MSKYVNSKGRSINRDRGHIEQYIHRECLLLLHIIYLYRNLDVFSYLATVATVATSNRRV